MPRSAPTSVHVIFKTHLDVGFTDFSRNVIRRYLTDFLPRAMDVARQMREQSPDRFIWTTGSYLIHEFLQTASPANRRRMERAIELGDIVYHALPFTTHTELMDAPLFAAALNVAQDLDRRLGRKTIAAKMTDVPGHTRAVLPLLAEAGVQLLHIGVNPACTPPAVPTVFNWRDSHGAAVTVVYDIDYGGYTPIPSTNVALAIAFTGDNIGPQTVAAATEALDRVRRRFGQASVRASNLNDFAADILPFRAKFPTLSDEIGDTWIHGAATDPYKVAAFRELTRLRNQWIAGRKLQAGSPRDLAMSLRLLLVAEHTWGMDEKTHLDDYTNYSLAQVNRCRKLPKWRRFEQSWHEQRDYLNQAIAQLPKPLAAEAKTCLAALRPSRPNVSRWAAVGRSEQMQTPGWDIGFDPRTGGINRLINRETGRTWADATHPLAVFNYETFTARDYQRYLRQYTTQLLDWAIKDLTKPGIEKLPLRHKTWTASSSRLFHERGVDSHHFLAELDSSKLPPGAPRSLFIEYVLSTHRPIIEITLRWFDKPANRLPEAMWLGFQPPAVNAKSWAIHKLGQFISPLQVVRNGNRHLHAADQGVRYQDTRGSMSIVPWDSPVVAPGKPSLLDFNNQQPDLRRGVSFCLYTNVWGTNFPMWYDQDGISRFRLTFQ